MAVLPENVVESATVQAIYAAYEKRHTYRPSRRMGASVVGKACDRAVWYGFRWATTETFEGRMLRLFDTGHREEPRFAEDLRAIGCEVYLLDPDTNRQIEFVAIGGHFVDRIDGMAIGVPEAPKTWHVLEFKTHSAKSFASLRAEGLAKAKPEHRAQLVTGMHMAGMERGLYLAKNKDNDELYAERIRYDAAEAIHLMTRAEQIIAATQAPARITDKRDDFRCTYCPHRAACWGDPSPAAAVAANVNCRTCCHATPVVIANSNAGTWRCEKHGRSLSASEQMRGCHDHLFLPDFVTFATPIDSGVDGDGSEFVLYASNPDGTQWHNGRGRNMYRSVELQQLPAQLVGAGIVDTVKQTFGGTAVEAPA